VILMDKIESLQQEANKSNLIQFSGESQALPIRNTYVKNRLKALQRKSEKMVVDSLMKKRNLSPRKIDLEFEQEELDEMDRRFEEDKLFRRFGLPDSDEQDYIEGSSDIVKHDENFALVKHHDPYSPASEHPVSYEIRDKKGITVWKSGITQMAEFAHAGQTPSDVTPSIREEAEEVFKNMKWQKEQGII